MKKSIFFFAVLFISGSLLNSCMDSSTGPDAGHPGFSHVAAPGDSAHAFLSNQQYTRLNIEIDYMEGYKPSPEAEDNLISFLQQRLNKVNIQIKARNAIPPAGKNAYTAEDIVTLEQRHRDYYTETDSEVLTAYMLVVDGEYAESANVLGIAYFNTSMAFFGQTMEAASGMPPASPSREKVETTVFRHEFGHNLGLVANGSPMQQEHQDEAHGKHCDAQSCLMYYAVETTDFFANLSGSVPQLDAQCINDLQANGGK